jgi:NTE family protein
MATARAEERIGLVLGGGGARGAAHIGVIKLLERERIPIHAIAGTSMGAIVGGMYASGYSPEEMEQILGSVDWVDVFQDGSPREQWPMRQKEIDLGNVANLEFGRTDGRFTLPTALIRGQRLGLLLRRIFLGREQLASFDELPIPFRAVATDLGSIRPVVFASGDLVLAIRASMSLPATFSPVRHEGKVLIDGGVVDNLPVVVARQMGVDRLIVVDVGSDLAPAEEVESPLAVLDQVIGGLMREHTDAALRSMTDRDVYLRPDLAGITTLSFDRILDAVAPGERAATAQVERLRDMAAPEAAYLAWRTTQRQRFPADQELAFVRVESARSKTAQFVDDRLTREVGGRLDGAKLERAISGAFGRGDYDGITYTLEDGADGRKGLVVTPIDSALGQAVFRVGLQISDDFAGNSDYQFNGELRVKGLTSRGAEWRTLLEVGRLTSVTTEFYLPFGHQGRWFVRPDARYNTLNQQISLEGTTVAEYRLETLGASLNLGRDFGGNFRVSAGVLRAEDRARRKIALPFLPGVVKDQIGGYTSTLLWDDLDNVKFPRRGQRAEIRYDRYDESFGSEADGDLLRISIDKPFSMGPHTLMLGTRVSLSPQDLDAFATQATLGGLTFLSGLADRELIDQQMLLFRGIYYRRLSRQRAFFDLPVYFATSLEAGNVWRRFDDVSLGDMTGAASIFLGVDLPLGPLQVGYGRTFDGDQALYLTFGSLVLPRFR